MLETAVSVLEHTRGRHLRWRSSSTVSKKEIIIFVEATLK
jgi:hypothetical protein